MKYRRKVSRKHPWKCMSQKSFAKNPDRDIYAYVAEGMRERQIKSVGKDNRGGHTREVGTLNYVGKNNFTNKS